MKSAGVHSVVEQLLEASRRGSREALGELLEVCRQYLLLIANSEMPSSLQAKGGASDIVQETFLEAQRDFELFRGKTEAELLAWLRRILLNNLTNFRRHYQGVEKRQVGREVALDAGLSTDQPGGVIFDDNVSPSVQAMSNEQASAVEAAMVRLPEAYRNVILLRHRDQKSFEEVSQILGCSMDAARKLWARAIERLQRELGVA